MKKMLINATQKEEVRIALVEDKQLIDLDVEQRKNDNKKSNIYNGVISRVEPSLEACFVNYGEQRDGFLPIKDIHPSYYENLPGNSAKDKLKPGQKLIVQVAREERGNKGAALTTYVAIASTFLVLMPKSPDVEGISRRLSGEERDSLRQKLNSIGIKPTEGVIVRTAGTGCTTEELQYDLNILHFIWDMIQKYSEENPEVGILHHESETIVRVIRDYLTKDVDEIITDSRDAFNKVAHYLKLVRPKSKPHLTLKDVDNIFSCPEYDIESQIAQAYDREVKLKSGGSIVIDTTEALTAIDVNSSRSTGNQDIESTAISTNLEAADEIARQLKIRDIGGLIVIDFIDMNSTANQRKVEERMKKACGDDRARTQLARISKFGLLEVSRQRIRGSIAESINHKCPRCSGTGFIRDNESISLQILRQANEEATRVGKIVKLHIMVPNDIAAYLLNEKREKIRLLEQQHNIQIVVVPQAGLESPHYFIYRVRKGDTVKDNLSFNLPEYYRELEKAPRKARAVDRNDEKLTQSSTSVPLEHIDKTFEARLEKAEFIQQAVAKEEAEKSLFHRAKRWFVGLFTKLKPSPKTEEVVKEKVVSSRRKRRRSRKERNRSTVNAEVTTDSSVNSVDETIATPKLEKASEKAFNNKRNRAEKVASESINTETTPVSVRKQIKSGDVVEEVLGGTSKRKRRKKEKAAFADINPQEVKSIVDQQEAYQDLTSESKPKLTRAERRRLQKVKDLDPEYDYEFSEENLGLDIDAPPKSRRRKEKATKISVEAEKGIELSQEDIVESKLELLDADEFSTDIQVPRKASRSERRRLAQERQAQNASKEATALDLNKTDDQASVTNDVVAKPEVNTSTKIKPSESVNKSNFEGNEVAVTETNLDNATILNNNDRKKSRRRRKVNIEKKDLFLSRVPTCIDQDTLNSWLNTQACEDLVDDIDVSEYQHTPNLMDVVASDGSVDIKERSPYRQVVRPSLPARKSNVYLGTVNSADFEESMAKALANTTTTDQANSLTISDDSENNFDDSILTNNNVDDTTNLDSVPVNNDSSNLADNVSLDKDNGDKPLEALSRRERARRAKAAKQEKTGNNTSINSYRYFVFKAKQPCVNFNVEYDKVNRSKKRYNASLNKKSKPKAREEIKTLTSDETTNMIAPANINMVAESSVATSVVKDTSKSQVKNSNSHSANSSQPAKEILFTQFDDYAKNVGFTEELQTIGLNNLNTNINPRNHLNSITEELKDLTSKKQKAEVKLNDNKEPVILSPLDANLKPASQIDSTITASQVNSRDDIDQKEKTDTEQLDNSDSTLNLVGVNSDAQTQESNLVKVSLPKESNSVQQPSVPESKDLDKNSNLGNDSNSTLNQSSTKVSSFINLPDDSALIVFANKTTNVEANLGNKSSLELPLLDDLSEVPCPTEACQETKKDGLRTISTQTTASTTSGGVLSRARSFSVGSTTTKVEHSDIEIPTTFDQYQSNYTYHESGKSVSSPSKHTSTK